MHLLEVLGYRLRGGEMNTDGAVFFALFVDPQGHLLTVVVKVLHPQPAGPRQPHLGVEIGL